MRHRIHVVIGFLPGFLAGFVVAFVVAASLASAMPSADSDLAKLEAELRSAESAFAATMAARDLDAFTSFLAAEVVFFSGDQTLRGRQAVTAAWTRFFEGDAAPFSWEPEAVAVLESGTLGLTSGPVFGPAGERFGTFNSVWRRTAAGHWEIVFDRGCPDCSDE